MFTLGANMAPKSTLKKSILAIKAGEKKSVSQEFEPSQFQSLNLGYNRVFRAGELSIGLVVAIENYDPTPSTHRTHSVVEASIGQFGDLLDLDIR